MLKIEELELEKISKIQRFIAASLHADVVLWGEVQDIYLHERLKLILQSNQFWSLWLLLEPMDSDFLNLAYRIMLKREPDPQGLNHFHSRLAANTCRRIDILKEIVESIEFKQTCPHGVEHGKCLLIFLGKLNTGMRKVKPLITISQLVWMWATGFRRRTRQDLIMRKIQDELKDVKEREMYLLEYVRNKENRYRIVIKNQNGLPNN